MVSHEQGTGNRGRRTGPRTPHCSRPPPRLPEPRVAPGEEEFPGLGPSYVGGTSVGPSVLAEWFAAGSARALRCGSAS